MSKRKFTRRTMLRGLIGGGATVAIGLPVFDLFCNENGTAFAAGGAFPKRFGVWYWGNGNLPDRWTPIDRYDTDGTYLGYDLSEQLMPLQDVRDDVTIVTGTEAASTAREPHVDGAASFLSGTPITRTGQHEFLGKTIDVIIREAIGGQTVLPSIEAAVEPGITSQSYSINGPGSSNAPTVDPVALYELVFGDGGATTDTDVEIRRWRLRRSALSSVMEEADALQDQLGAHDRRRLDEHFTSIRELELRLASWIESPPDFSACQAPGRPNPAAYGELDSRPQMDVRHGLVSDILTQALVCDKTRVFHTLFTKGGSQVRFPGMSTGHHLLSHKFDAESLERLTTITQFIVRQYASFVSKLASVQEGDCRLIDNVALLATSGCSLGSNHEIDEYPILIAGGAGGSLRTGLHLRSQGELASKVCFSLLRAMGAAVPAFGVREAEATEGLPGLEV